MDQDHLIEIEISRARSAYAELAGLGPDLPPDVTLARLPAYSALLAAGVRLRGLLGRQRFQRLQACLMAPDGALAARSQRDMPRLWAGLAEWPQPTPEPVLH